MKPTIGRVVHFNWSGARVPAVVTFVRNDTSVDLQTLGSRGGGGEYTACSLASETPESAAKLNEIDTPHGTWSWPPRA